MVKRVTEPNWEHLIQTLKQILARTTYGEHKLLAMFGPNLQPYQVILGVVYLFWLCLASAIIVLRIDREGINLLHKHRSKWNQIGDLFPFENNCLL